MNKKYFVTYKNITGEKTYNSPFFATAKEAKKWAMKELRNPFKIPYNIKKLI